jgi:phosphopantothenoylcysteine decarboxylase/phosphopantothenate--cysteine ligase
MGFAIAEELYLQGADVSLITGPTHEKLTYKGITRKNVKSALDMYNASHEHFAATDIAVMSAAVADYTPETIATEKVKKKEDSWAVNLTKTKDILFSLGQIKQQHQFIVGFALETNNEKENALGKLKNKNADCIVLNSLNDYNTGFGYDTNKITILHKSGEEINFELKSKKEVAKDIVSFIISKIHE